MTDSPSPAWPEPVLGGSGAGGVAVAAGLGEAAGHLAGGITPTLEGAGLSRAEAEAWEADIQRGWFLIGAHVTDDTVEAARGVMTAAGAVRIAEVIWQE